MKAIKLLVALFFLAVAWAAFASYFSVHCPKCGKPFVAEPVSIVTTNETVLNGRLTRNRLVMQCPYCKTRFKARAEHLEREELAIELPEMPAKIEQPPIPLLLPSVRETNLVVLTAPLGFCFRTVRGVELDLNILLALFQTNRANLTLTILEPCPSK